MLFRIFRMDKIFLDFDVIEDKRVNIILVQDQKRMLFFFLCKYEWFLNVVSKEFIYQFNVCVFEVLLICFNKNIIFYIVVVVAVISWLSAWRFIVIFQEFYGCCRGQIGELNANMMGIIIFGFFRFLRFLRFIVIFVIFIIIDIVFDILF